MFLQLSAVVFCSMLWLPGCVSDCPYKECACGGILILCEKKNLVAIPPLVSASTSGLTFLDMMGNQIRTIPAGSLPNYLESINFEENPLATIDDSAFDGSATTLQSLYLSNTNLTRLPDGFRHFSALSYLSIVGANITSWDDEAMKNIGQTLTTLNLQNVGMTTWPTWLQYFGRLSDLTLSGSSISSVPDNALDSFANSLTGLSLYTNRLTMVPKAISKLKNLQKLYLFENKITDVTFIPQFSNLTSISLSSNKISNADQLSKVLSPFGATLISLDIDNNLLASIPDFRNLTNIGSLDLTNNLLSDPMSGAAPYDLFLFDLSYNYLPSVPKILVNLLGVTDITLSYNSIRSVQAADFHNQTNSVDLSYNLIPELTDSSFPPKSAIMYIQLNNNPLSRISDGALKDLPNLFELNLRSTKLTRLPLALAFLDQLSIIDVSNCMELVCTCLESSLTAWVAKMRQDNVHGNCGHTSVYVFYTQLSQSCPKQ